MSVKHALVAILALGLVGAAGEAFGDEWSLGRDSLETKPRRAPVRGRRLAPGRAQQARDRDAAAEWRREDRNDRDERSGGRGGNKDDSGDE
jgi:hypothetical protein